MKKIHFRNITKAELQNIKQNAGNSFSPFGAVCAAVIVIFFGIALQRILLGSSVNDTLMTFGVPILIFAVLMILSFAKYGYINRCIASGKVRIVKAVCLNTRKKTLGGGHGVGNMSGRTTYYLYSFRTELGDTVSDVKLNYLGKSKTEVNQPFYILQIGKGIEMAAAEEMVIGRENVRSR